MHDDDDDDDVCMVTECRAWPNVLDLCSHCPSHSLYTDYMLPFNDVNLETMHSHWIQNEGGGKTFHTG